MHCNAEYEESDSNKKSKPIPKTTTSLRKSVLLVSKNGQFLNPPTHSSAYWIWSIFEWSPTHSNLSPFSDEVDFACLCRC